MANSADPDQLAYDEATDLDPHYLQWQGISGLSRTKVNKYCQLFTDLANSVPFF